MISPELRLGKRRSMIVERSSVALGRRPCFDSFQRGQVSLSLYDD
jgi:hypothetical protein